MDDKKGIQEKNTLHPRNKNRNPYDLTHLVAIEPTLEKFITRNKNGFPSIDFSRSEAVKSLNKALLKSNYNLHYWDFPKENLCPPIPGRADYLHYIADLLATSNDNIIPVGKNIKGLDIGTGATCIYPIIGTCEYDWTFIASDINVNSIKSSSHIIDLNPQLLDKIKVKLQSNPKHFFKSIIDEGECINFTMCNPPFHASIEEAKKGTQRKLKGLSPQKKSRLSLNFAGITNELIYEGGEITFIEKMIKESELYRNQCLWFTTLVSKESNLKKLEYILQELKVSKFIIIPMSTGNKNTRILAWSFLDTEKRKRWSKERWTTL